jgi:hypothetical protein
MGRRHPPTKWIPVLFAAAVCGMVLEVLSSANDAALSNLNCVALVVSMQRVPPRGAVFSEDSQQRTQELERALYDTLLVGIRAKLPRLQIQPSCPNKVLLWGIMKGISLRIGGPIVDMSYGMMELSIVRRVIIQETQEAVDTASVWTGDSFIMHVPPEDERHQLLSGVDQLLTGFAAAYYQSGKN